MTRDDSTGPDILQDSALADSFLVSAATKARRISSQFGWPALFFFAIAPRHPLGREVDHSFLFALGLPALLLGLLIRTWSRGFQRREGFVLDGPYRYVRNPVEVGAVICFMGAGAILGLKLWFNVFIAVFAMLYLSFTSIAYERDLYLKMGAAYLRYCQRVRRWIPHRFPATNRSNLTFSFGRAFVEERESLLWVIGYIAVFAARKRFGF